MYLAEIRPNFATHVAVASCVGAHAFLDHTAPTVVIVDIMLMDGPCHHIADRLVAAGVPFVVHSADHPRDYVDTPFAAGTWINKPSVASEFLAATLAAAGAG